MLSEEQKMLQTEARKLAREKLAPIAATVDCLDESSPEYLGIISEMYDLARAHGLLAIGVPEQYGGPGVSITSQCLLCEELSKIFPSLAVNVFGSIANVSQIIAEEGNEEQRQRYLPRMAKQEIMGGFALTEPEAGSDAASVKARAVRQGDHFIINGTKCFITNAGLDDIYIVFAVTDPDKGRYGISAIVVEKDAPGLTLGKLERKMGLKGSPTGTLYFDDVKVPVENLVGSQGQGLHVALHVIDRAHCMSGAMAVGITQGALDYALDYAKQRVQFGRPIIEFQGIEFMLADMDMQNEAARALVYKLAALYDSGHWELRKLSAIVKCFATDVAMRATTDAVQVLGGYGYIKDHPVERLMRDAKVFQIFDGTNQVLRMVIARQLAKGGA